MSFEIQDPSTYRPSRTFISFPGSFQLMQKKLLTLPNDPFVFSHLFCSLHSEICKRNQTVIFTLTFHLWVGCQPKIFASFRISFLRSLVSRSPPSSCTIIRLSTTSYFPSLLRRRAGHSFKMSHPKSNIRAMPLAPIPETSQIHFAPPPPQPLPPTAPSGNIPLLVVQGSDCSPQS